MGCGLYHVFTGLVKDFIKKKYPVDQAYIDPRLPFIVDKNVFCLTDPHSRSDELLHGVYSVFSMGEFVSSNLRSVSRLLLELVQTILQKVRCVAKANCRWRK